MKPLLRVVLVLIAIASGLAGQADELIGINGERFIGKVIEETAAAVVFESELGGRLVVPRERIREIRASPERVPVPSETRAAAHSAEPEFEPKPLPAPSDTRDSGVPFDVATNKFDWIQLKSGEWLKGILKAMQDEKLEFDSEELELQTFDWKDIPQVYSPKQQDLWFDDGERLSGPIRITRQEVVVREGQEFRHLPRSQLTSITPGGTRPRDHLSGKISAGLTVRSGNTESLEYNAQAEFQWRTPNTRLILDYIGNISTLSGEENANNHRISTLFDYWLSRRFFLRIPFVEYYRDTFQNLDHRLTGGAGVGYDLIDRSKVEWSIAAGPAYQHNWFHSVQPGEPMESGAAALSFGSRFDWEITKRIDLLLEYRGQFTRREIGETTHHSVSTLSVELSKRLDLDISFVWDRITTPQQDAEGTTPHQDDFRTVLSLGVRF